MSGTSESGPAMFSLTGQPMLMLMVAAAAAAVVGVIAVAVRRGGSRSTRHRILTRAVPVAVLVLLGQASAVGAVALSVNDTYGFYTSWADLTGQVVGNATIQTGGLVGTGQGRIQVLTVHKHRIGRDDRVLVWLPPQYGSPAYAHRRFPVVMFLAGQPSAPQVVFRQFHFAQVATRAVSTGQVPPFIGVFPTLMIDPPRDTECTNIPGGPRAESWLASDVPAFVTSRFRAQPLGRGWSTMGWSTGGFCASKLVTAHPAQFTSAVGFGAYYQPIQDHTTGSLFRGRRMLELHNSPQWLYLHRNGLHQSRLLVVSGRQDQESWPSSRQMLSATAGDPAVSHIVFPVGGHNYGNYAAYLAPALRWSARSWAP